MEEKELYMLTVILYLSTQLTKAWLFLSFIFKHTKSKIILIFFSWICLISYSNAFDIKFESLPDWEFKSKQTADKLFSHDNKNFIGTLTKKNGDVAATLFVFKVSQLELKNSELSAVSFLNSKIMPKEAKLIEFERKLKSKKTIKLRTYKNNESIIYVYIYFGVKNIYYLTQDTTQESMKLDLDATMPELSKMEINESLL